MKTRPTPIITFKSGGGQVVRNCQVCDATDLRSILFLGYLPPVNAMREIGARPQEEASYPAELLWCPHCQLVQLGLLVDPEILFPESYPYTSSTTKILRDNFSELSRECAEMLDLDEDSLVVDIGSNDGNLLVNFKDAHRVCGVTPEEIGKIAIERGVPTLQSYFGAEAVDRILKDYGQAALVTATNVFAHMEDVHGIVDQVKRLLTDDGVFMTESHYLLRLVETLQYDTVYHEHLRYYSLHSLKNLLAMHDLEIFHAKEIPTHGGSIRVYAARAGTQQVHPSVAEILALEEKSLHWEGFAEFGRRTADNKARLWGMLSELRRQGKRIVGIGAPSRASTLLNYLGVDHDIVDTVLEIKGSHKIGKYLPGTTIPIKEEALLFEEQPDYAILLSWHIADELIPKLKEKGFKNSFIVPLPEPRIV